MISISSTIWTKRLYRAPIDCIVDSSIREYDIAKANISVLREKGILTEEQYRNLYTADKQYREIYIGKLQGSNPSIYPILKDGIADARRLFIEMNDIQDGDILSINNDAIYILGDRYIHTQQVSPNVYFKLSSSYNSMYRVNRIAYYYYYNAINKIELLNPKGLGEYSIAQHERFMLDFLKELFYTVQMIGVAEALQLLSKFYSDYVSLQLSIEYYRNLDSQAMYQFKPANLFSSTTNKYFARILPSTTSLNVLDIGYNAVILREFEKLLSTVYFRYNRG